MNRGECLALGCHEEARAKGLCFVHYARAKRNGGDPNQPTRTHGLGHFRKGYVLTSIDGEAKLEHVRVAELALGHPLPPGAVVHHVNEVKTDNRNSNLVICPNREYHNLLHVRTAAFDASGHADWRKCHICGVYADQRSLKIYPSGAVRHTECERQANAKRKYS